MSEVVSEKKKEETKNEFGIVEKNVENGMEIITNIQSCRSGYEVVLWREKWIRLSDVDARIKFYDENNFSILLLIRKYPGLKGELDRFILTGAPCSAMEHVNAHSSFLSWLFVFCFGDMDEDFREKIKRLEK